MRPITTCTHTVQHYHGTSRGYSVCSCRCDDCRRARRNSTKIARPLVDATPVQNHIRNLVAAGMSMQAITTAAGVTQGAARVVLEADRVRRLTAFRFLSVRVTVTSIGMRRRMQALVAAGWTQGQIGEQMGISQSAVSLLCLNEGRFITASVAANAVTAYEAMWRGPAVPSPHALRTARRHKWAPPLAWDDETIDDARTKPAGMEQPETTLDELVEDLLDMAASCRSWTEAVARCGFRSAATLERRLYRAGRMDEVRAAFRGEVAAA